MRMQYGLSFHPTGFRYVCTTSRKNIYSLAREITSFPKEENEEEDDNGKQDIGLFHLIPSEYEAHLQQLTKKGLQGECLSQGHIIHTVITVKGHDLSIFVTNNLMHMYGKSNAMEEAWCLFHRMNQKNVFSWNIMIGLNQHHDKEAYHIFLQMLMEGVAPDKVSFVNTLSSFCSSSRFKALGKWLHSCLVAVRLDLDVFVGTALITMYSNCGSLEDALMMFNCMPLRNTVTWSAMIGACVQHEAGEEALELLSEMESQGVAPRKVTLISSLAACSGLANESIGLYIHNCITNSAYETDTVVGTALVDMYGKCGNLIHAEYIFKNMLDKNILSWTAMIGVYAMHGDRDQTLFVFNKMLSEGMLPDQVSFLCILSACNHLGLIDESCIVFGSMIHDHGIAPTVEHYNCVIDLLSRIGRLDEGEQIMNDMPFQANNSTLLSLLAACRMHFDMERAERTAHRAIKLDPQNPAPYLLLGIA